MATFAGNPAATPLTGAEIVPITQGGVDKRTTVGQIGDAVAADIDPALITFSNSAFTADNVEDAIVEASTMGGAGVSSVQAGHGVDVDATDPDNPIVAVDEAELDSSLMPFSHSGFAATNVEDAIVEASTGGGGGMTNPMTTPGDIIVGDVGGAPERLAKGTDGQVLRMVGGVQAYVFPLQTIAVAISDEVTNLTTGVAKATIHMPYAFTLTAVMAGVSVQQTAGSILTFDINEAGSSILSTKLTIDNSESTSGTAATPAVISDTSLAQFAAITFDIDQVGTPLAKGAKIYLIGYPTP